LEARVVRVVHGPVNVGNQPWVLAQAERRLGAHSDLVVVSGDWLAYPAHRFLNTGRSSWVGRARRVVFGALAPMRYDVMHLYFGQSYLHSAALRPSSAFNYLDVRLARCLGRKLFMTLQGCDARLSDESDRTCAITMCRPGHCPNVTDCRTRVDDRRRAFIRDILPWFDRVFVVNPELARVVPDSVFLPYCNADLTCIEAAYPSSDGRCVIVHAPTNEGVKGSRYIIAAVERLQKRWPIEFVLVHGLRHEEAMRLYRRADLVIDQVLAGWYGGFAVETMAMGKPVACYMRTADLAYIPPAMRADLPIVPVSLDTLEADLEHALERRREWTAWGRRAREFAFRWHNPTWIARLMLEAYRDSESRFTARPYSAAAQAA
jgi:hypothetical protein